jgi:hypothetical protein
MFRALSLLALCGTLTAQTHVCTVTDAGNGCAPLVVTMTPQGGGGVHDLVLTASGLHPSSFGGMIWGMSQLNVAVIPGSLCPLLTDYVWGHYFQTSPSGDYSWSRAWPGTFHGYFYMQMGSVFVDANGYVDARTTDCKLVQCLLP